MPSDTSPTVQYSHALAAPSASYPLTVAHFLLLTLCRRLQLLTLCLWYHLQLQLLTLSQSPWGRIPLLPLWRRLQLLTLWILSLALWGRIQLRVLCPWGRLQLQLYLYLCLCLRW